MSTSPNAIRLFNGSCAALSSVAVSVVIRANIIPLVTAEFGFSNEQMGAIAGTAFWGFALGLVAGPFCDKLGMGRILRTALLAHLTGLVLSVTATGYYTLYVGTLVIGLGNGLAASVCNPLIANLFRENRAAKINRFHAWYPISCVLGGLAVFFLTQALVGWRWQVVIMLVPVGTYAVLFYGQHFPPTERKQMGASMADMLRACTHPLFLCLLACIALANPTEVATTQWVTALFSDTGLPPILLLVLICTAMGLGRYFAAPVVRHTGTVGLLLLAATLSFAGLALLTVVQGGWALAAAALFGYGVGFLIPTTYATLAENLPKAGSLGTSLVAATGMTSTSILVRAIGAKYDANILTLRSEGLASELAKIAAGVATLQTVALLPLVLMAAYTGLLFWKRQSNQALTSPFAAR
jgi:MFS family permease